MKQIKFQLKNKLNVILAPSHKSPVVSVQMWVKTGSADEAKGEEGMSHFIEHLVFKGTDKYGVGEIASTVEASGGELNAYTSFDQTVFYVTISKNYSDVALGVVSQMMGFPLFDAKETHSEREVVCEEIKMGMDSPSRAGSQMLFSSMYKKHAYGIPVIGYEKNVRGWSVKKIKKYYADRYSPANMCLVITGDFNIGEMKAKVDQYYSKIKLTKLVKRTRKKEPMITKPSWTAISKKFPEKQMYLSFPAPSVKHKDVPALDILSQVLGLGDTSRLVQKLRLEKPLVNGIGAFNYSPQDPGLFALSLKYSDQNPHEILGLVWNEIEKIKQFGILDSELKRAIVSLLTEQFYSIETVDGIAQRIGSSQFYLGDSRAHEKYLTAVQKLKPIDIQKIAKKYLVKTKMQMSLMSPDSEKTSKEILKTAYNAWNLAPLDKKANYLKPQKAKKEKIAFHPVINKNDNEVKKIVTAKGTEILFLENKEIPTFSAKFIFGGGARLETPETMGLAEMLHRTWLTKTKSKNELEISTIIEDCAGAISPFAGKNTIGLSVHGLQHFENRLLDLTEELFTEFDIDETAFDREKVILKTQIQSQQDKPSVLCAQQFNRKMFPHHPISFDTMGTEHTLANVTPAAATKLFKQSLREKNMQLCVVGDYDEKKWVQVVERIEKLFSKGDGGRLRPEFAVEPLKKRESFFIEKDKEQSHVIVGWHALNLTDPDRYVLQVIQAVMAGQGGRLFMELRDKNSLAYSVSPIKMESLETGYFGGYIACSPEKVQKSIELFDMEFKKICNEKIPQSELERAQKYLIGQHDIGLQRKSSMCNLISFDNFYGNDYHESLNVAHEYSKITVEDVQRVAKSIFTKPSIISVVGKKV